MDENSRTGVPLMRPMFLEFPDNPDVATNGEEYMFGSSLLVAPRVWNFVGAYHVTLPKGDWYDYWTGTRQSGGNVIDVDPPMELLPVYVRGGSIVPQQPVVQYVGEKIDGPLELRVYPGPECAGDLYSDDGDTLAYQRGENLRVHFACSVKANAIEVATSAAKGSYQPWFKNLQVTVYGVPGKTSGVQVDGKAVTTWKQDAGVVTVSDVPWTGQAHTVRVNVSMAK